MKRLAALVVSVGMLLLGGCGQGGRPVPVVTKTIVVTVPPTESPPPSPASGTSPSRGTGAWKAVACAIYSTLALRQDGTLWSWGLDDYGQLGQGTLDVIAHPTPHPVGHAHDWATVSCGDGDAFAVKEDGTLWAWGNNTDWGGNLGLGGSLVNVDMWVPTRVGRAHDWAAVSSGYEHGLAIREDGSLWSWGINFLGALGMGNTSTGYSPAEIGSGADWTAAAGGGDFSLALKRDGTLWAWGSDAYGNLGLGDTLDRRSPVEVGRASDWAAVSAGVGYSLALKKDGTLWAWGDDGVGELGLGDTVERHAPTQVASAHDWAAIASLGHHSLALKRDGTLWAWGENSYGQLGLGDATDRHTPTQVGASHDWAAIAAGCADSYHTLALRKDGTLWAWGFNQFGQLGLRDTTDRNLPTQVGTR
jgi:alpha-tubulin suppressor-like RCC1 family protein